VRAPSVNAIAMPIQQAASAASWDELDVWLFVVDKEYKALNF
jgi:hypothetical protein